MVPQSQNDVMMLHDEVFEGQGGTGEDDDDDDDDEDDDEEAKDEEENQNSDLDHSERERKQQAKDEVRAHMSVKKKEKFEVNYTVGRIEDGDAILLSQEHNILNVPLSLLPKGIEAGNILKFTVGRNLELERKREALILSI
jgi:hypothetical protein